jgi:hypothetical protein
LVELALAVSDASSQPGCPGGVVNARLTIKIKLHFPAKSIFENFR